MRRERLYDVRRIWEPDPEDEIAEPPRRRSGVSAEIAAFAPKPRLSVDDPAACRKRTRAELRQIAMSLRSRDMLLRNGLADRCAKCGKCSDMVG